MIINNSKLYDILKFLAQIGLPALGTLYFTLAEIWGLPAAEEVVGTIVAVDTFLGVVLQLSSNAYEKNEDRFAGTMDITETDDGKKFMLILNDEPTSLETAKEITFKVRLLE